MFHTARIKLTAWYLLIISVITISFSLAVYRILSSELDRVERIQRLRADRNLVFTPPLYIDPDLVTETKYRIQMILFLIDFGIIGGGGAVAYFLAGRTLSPIKIMVDEQRRFITDASHELRTPITSLKSEIEVNLRDPNLNLSDAKKLLASNLEDVNTLQTLSDGLIKLSMYQKGQNNFTAVRFPLNEVVSEAVKKISTLARKKHISISSDCPEITVHGEKTSITELLVILLDNSVKYSPAGSRVEITARQENKFTDLRVTDQGPGIDPQDIPHVFDRFYRADKSRTKNNIPGYGLGLSIAKQIVDRHHGSISVESVPDKGSTFIVQIPKDA
jgi:two-component system sensor histidine kinase CiaH